MKKANLYKKIKNTAGGFHGWYESDVGIIKKENKNYIFEKAQKSEPPKVVKPVDWIYTQPIMEKFVLKSSEVWVLGSAILLAIGQATGIDFEGVLGNAQTLWISLAPVVALLLRIFKTSTKLTFKLGK